MDDTNGLTQQFVDSDMDEDDDDSGGVDHNVAQHTRTEDLDDEDLVDDSNDEIGEPPYAPLPPYLKDISSLASWTVSSHKPGCGVAALRHESPNYFWQSDGPQPHHLNIHFFKMVSIAYIRVFLDYEQDESYTPTKLHFVAGTGHHDLQDVCTMAFREPKGWLDVDLSNAGGPNAFEDVEVDDEAVAEHLRTRKSKSKKKLPGHGPTLRCRLIQLRILENHQNGKDTHLRGLQIFAVDESAVRVRRKKRPSIEPSKVSSFEHATSSTVSSSLPAAQLTSKSRSSATSKKGKERPIKPLPGLREPDWMDEPFLR